MIKVKVQLLQGNGKKKKKKQLLRRKRTFHFTGIFLIFFPPPSFFFAFCLFYHISLAPTDNASSRSTSKQR